MKSKGKRCQPESGCRDPAPVDVTNDHANAGDAVHLAKERQGVFAREMVQHLRAHHHIDAAVRERQPQGVGAHG
jgi:hypothetical protein